MTRKRGRIMQRKQVALITATLLALPAISIPSAVADNRTPAPATQSFSDMNAAYKIAFDKFREDAKKYEESRRAINQIFKDTIDKALTDARNLNLTAQTQMQKRQNMTIKQGAVGAAVAARDAAIEALGTPPIAPTPPAKPQRTEKVRR